MGGSYDRKAGLQGSVLDHDAGVVAGDPQFGNIAAGNGKDHAGPHQGPADGGGTDFGTGRRRREAIKGLNQN